MGMRWSKTLAVVLVGTAYAKLQSPVSLKVGEWYVKSIFGECFDAVQYWERLLLISTVPH